MSDPDNTTPTPAPVTNPHASSEPKSSSKWWSVPVAVVGGLALICVLLCAGVTFPFWGTTGNAEEGTVADVKTEPAQPAVDPAPLGTPDVSPQASTSDSTTDVTVPTKPFVAVSCSSHTEGSYNGTKPIHGKKNAWWYGPHLQMEGVLCDSTERFIYAKSKHHVSAECLEVPATGGRRSQGEVHFVATDTCPPMRYIEDTPGDYKRMLAARSNAPDTDDGLACATEEEDETDYDPIVSGKLAQENRASIVKLETEVSGMGSTLSAIAKKLGIVN